jgi:hypothetical protein
MTTPAILDLSTRQLDAYNRSDLDAFCACYHPAVRVLEWDGRVRLEGMDAFRERYDGLFRDYTDVQASVSQRILLGTHVVEHERWSRRERATGLVTSGEVIVRYTLLDGTIGIAEFLA